MATNDPFNSFPDPGDDLDRVQLGRFTTGGGAGLGLPSFDVTRARFGQNALRDPQFLRQFFGNVPRGAMEDPGYLQYARGQALERGRSLQPRQNWWDDPRVIAERGYQSLLNDRAAQSEYFLRTYGFDPLTNQVANPNDAGYLQAAGRYGYGQAEAQRAAGFLGPQYGGQFSLTGQPGQGGLPFGYRQYTDEYGNRFLVDGRGNIVR